MVKMVPHIDDESFQISNLKNLSEKPSNLLKSLEFVIHQNFPCLMSQVSYEKAKRFTTKYLVNFIVTINLTFYKTLIWFCQPYKNPKVSQS